MPSLPEWPCGRYRQGYPAAGSAAPESRLHAAWPGQGETGAVAAWRGDSGDADRLLGIEGTILRIAPFRIDRWGQRYLSRGAIEVDFATFAPTRYRIVAVHNFRVEDRNPDLDECPAAVFLALKVDGHWEEAEDHPVECRSVALLGHLDVPERRIAPP